jgi:raffinose/stachyose/melibiose transport system permease protein
VKISTVVVIVLLSIVAISTLYPIIYMTLGSLKEKIEYLKDPFGFPQKPSLRNYWLLFNTYGVLKPIFNSIFTTVISIIITGFLCSLASFPLAKLEFKGKEFLFMFISAFMMVPIAVLMIPTYVLFSRIGLINNYLSIIIFWCVIDLPYGIYMMTSNLRSIPTDTIESARIDGASLFKVFYSIILPMGKPIIATMVIIYFMWNWNDLLMPMLLLQSESMTTLTVAVTTVIGRYFSNMPLLLAGLLINSLPTVTIYVIFQKYIIKGVTEGAIK